MRLKPDNNGAFFHPFEMCFSGFSKSGKTTLITKIISKLKYQFDIGYYKHDAHKLSIDHEGKDTWQIQQAGAGNVLINDQMHFANINHKELDQVEVKNKFIDSDILFIEGDKHSCLPKILLISEKSLDETLLDIKENKITNILAIVTESENDPFTGKYPCFQRDQSSKISDFIINIFKLRIPSSFNGLVLTGGKSQRMNEDKGGLIYHQENQINHTKKIMQPFCNEVYISCKESQKNLSFLQNQNLLFDIFPGGGPSIGILSALRLDPTKAWLVVGCDLPYLDTNTLHQLINNRNPFKNATCFLNPKRDWPEPICTIYEPKSFFKLMNYYTHGKPCPRKVLFNSNIEALKLENEMALENVNTPEQKEYALNYIKEHGEIYAN